MKKVLSLVLVIAMVLSSFSFAFAAKFEDVTGDYEEAVDVLAALGVVTGYEDGTFRPERIVTRAEMAKLIVEVLGYGDLVAGSKSNFSDTQGHWADAWIALAAGRGLVVGTGDGKFTPDRQVSYDEAITMVVRALGYTDNSNELKGMTWPTNFKVKAAELKLLNKVKSVAGGADRGGVAQLLFNALDATLVTVTTDGDVTALFDTVNGEKENRILLSRLAEKGDLDVNSNHIDPDHKDYKGNVVDLSQYMYQTVVAYEKDDVVVFVKEVKSLVITGTVTGIDEDEITIEDSDEDEYTFGLNLLEDFMYNGEEAAFDYGVLTEDEAKVTLVLKGDSKDKIKDDLKVLAIVATQASGYIQVEDTYVKDELTLDAIYLPKDGKVVDTDNLVIKGDADSLEDIEEDDVLAVFVPLKKGADDYFETSAANKMTIIVSKDTVEGKITKISGGDYYIGGKAHGLNSFAGLTLLAGDEGTFFLDHEGNIFAFKEEGSGAPKNYALILDVTDGWQTKVDGVVLAEPKVKLLTAAGEEITYVLDTDLTQVNDKDNGQTIKVNLAEGEVVKYDLDKNKVIDELDVVDMGDKIVDIKTDVNSFNLAKNAVIFNVPDGDIDDAEVIVADELDSKIDAYRFRNTKGEIEVLVVNKGGAEAEGIFALITKGDSDKNYAYDEDTEKQVILYTAYVDGVKVEYLKHKDGETINAGPEIVELTVSGGKLKAADVVTGSAVKTGVAENSRVTNSITDANDDTKVYFLADDVVVYVLKADGKFDKVGTKSDIRGKEFWVYDTIDGDQDYDIVVVKPVSTPL